MNTHRVTTRGTIPFPELASWSVDYQAVVASIDPSNPSCRQAFQDRLAQLWREAYLRHSPVVTELQIICEEGGTFILDWTGSILDEATIHDESIPDNRLVAAFGISHGKEGRRPATRIRGFPRGGLGIVFSELAQDFDRGHHLAHAAGGGVDINLYPQLASVNRGRDDDGKIFRAMEIYAASHAGTLVFSRPLYFGISDHPAAIDFGVLQTDGVLWQEVFRNVKTLEHLIALDKALTLVGRRLPYRGGRREGA